ncbi:MAG: TatD family hydrolase [Candidatus Berkelbacteria bacterium]|nr:TatD family hydrolase [Candidatus Berkelbacteria bacterium]
MNSNKVIDTHCHLNFKSFQDDFILVAKKARESGVEKIIIPGSDSQTSFQALENAKAINLALSSRPGLGVEPKPQKMWRDLPLFAYAAVGVHPIHTDRNGFETIEKLAELPEVVAIGETGLDQFHNRDNIAEQLELLGKHVDLALKINKPVIFHNRESDAEFLTFLKSLQKLPRGVFHCFSSDHHFAKEIIEMGFMISFTGNITWGNKKLKKVIERTPLERIMIETDSPYLVPEPFKSQGVERNEPAYVLEVAKKIAQIKNIKLEEVCSQTTQNAIEFFGL